MNSTLSTLGYDSISEHQHRITTSLSSYIEKTVNEDGSINYKEVRTTHFLENDKWNIGFFEDIPQFKEQIDNYKRGNKNITFPFNNPNINKEIKFIVYNKLFSDEWRLQSALIGQMGFIMKLSKFINEKYPSLNSILDINLDKANLKWIDWLNSKNIKTMRKSKVVNIEYQAKTPIANFLGLIYYTLFALTDNREEWEKDVWDVTKLEKYGINYIKSTTDHYVDFTKIDNLKIRNEVKKYMKQRLVANNKFSWGTARNYLKYLPDFLNVVCKLESTWNDLKHLERHHIEKYIEWLKIYSKENLTQKNANPQHHILKSISIIQKFLSDIQLWEYDIAPVKSVRVLIFPSDKPTTKKKPYDQIDYVPDFVLEQLFQNIDHLHKEVIPIVWVMYKTGLRISDVLGLKQDCLVKLNSKFWIETDIEKTYVQGHRIPIDDELANMLAVLIDNANKNSNQDNNPEKYIFVRYRGSRKGKPYSQGWVQKNLMNWQ